MKKIISLIVFMVFIKCLTYSQDQYLIDSLTDLVKSEKQDTVKVEILHELFLAVVDYDLDMAGEYAKQSLSVSEKAGYKAGMGKAYTSLAGIEFQRGNLDHSFELYDSAGAVMMEAGNNEGVALAYYGKAMVNIYQSDYAEAAGKLDTALEMFELLGKNQEIAGIYELYGTIYQNLGNYPEALKYQLNALRTYEGCDNKNRLAISNSNIGSTYIYLGDYKKAIEYLIPARDIFYQTNNLQGIAAIEANFGSIYYYQKDYPNALKCFMISREKFAEFGSQDGIASAYVNIGSIHDDQGNFEEAHKNFSEALKLYQEMGSQIYIANTYYNFGVLFTNQRKYTQASEYLNEALTMSKEIGNHDLTSECYEYLMIIDSTRGNFKRALERYKNHMAYRDSIINEENTRKTIELSMQFEFDKKQALAVKEQEKKDAIVQEELMKKRYQLSVTRFLSGGIGGMLLIITLIVMLYIQRKRSRSEKRALQLEQKLLRSQMNPHFIFNSLSSIQNYIVTEKPDKASIFLSKFARLVRNILDNSTEEFVTLNKEIDTIENYLELQKVRYAGKFDFRIDVDPGIDIDTVKIPPMLAQPFIENAIEHGIKHRDTPGHIDVRFRMKDQLLVFEVEDDGVGRQMAREIEVSMDPGHRSMATSLTRERLTNLNRKLNKKIELEIIDLKNALDEACGTKVIFGIPV